jgi:hypothetical protein
MGNSAEPPMPRAPNWHRNVFFGLHYDLHVNAEDTELGREVTPAMLREAWQAIGPDWVQCDCKGHPGYTSWPTKTGYPSPGIVRDALQIHREVTRELGIPLVMHYSGLWDEAAIQHHPSWARANAAGRREGGRACPRSGYLAELMIPQLLEVIDTYDVDGFWIDGDLWVAAPCYCERCRAAFREETGLAEPPRAPGQPGWEWWLAFGRRSYEAYARAYIDAVHARKPECLVCINWLYSARHPDPVSLPVDFLSGDFSHAWGVERAAVEARMLAGRGLPWDLMAWGFTTGEGIHGGWQFKTAAHLCQEVSEVLANGGAVCVYVHPPRSGRLIRWQHELLAQAIAQGSESVPQAVVLHSSTHYYAHNEPLYGTAQATQPMEGALHALLDLGYHADVLNEERLMARLHEYALVVVAEQDPISDDLAEALARYVEAGGRLVLSGAQVARHPALAALAGVEPAGQPREGFHHVPVGGVREPVVTVAGPWQPVRGMPGGSGTEIWRPLLVGPDPEVDQTGAAAITVRAVGRGRVAAVHGPIFAAYYRTRYPQLRRLLGDLFGALDAAPLVSSEGPIAQTWRRLPGRTIVHLLNRGATRPASPRHVLVEQVPPVGPVEVRLPLEAAPAAVRVEPPEAASSAQLLWEWSAGRLTARLAQVPVHLALVVEHAEPRAT